MVVSDAWESCLQSKLWRRNLHNYSYTVSIICLGSIIISDYKKAYDYTKESSKNAFYYYYVIQKKLSRIQWIEHN